MPKQPEGKLVQKIKKIAEQMGGRPFKIVGSEESFQEVGIPDLLVCYLGRFIGAEVKQRGESLRPAQRVILHEIYRAGGVAAVLETVEQAEELLSQLKVGRNREVPICYDRGVFRGKCSFSK
jgi:hypothetical protein